MTAPGLTDCEQAPMMSSTDFELFRERWLAGRQAGDEDKSE